MPEPTGGDLRARLAFAAMGRASRLRLRTMGWRRNDRLDPDFSCLTTIFRVPEPVGVRIEAALVEVRSRWPRHAYYPPASMHVTVLNIDPYVPTGSTSAGEGGVIENASEALARHRGFRVMLRGLTVSPWTVFAMAYGADRPVAAMRGTLRRVLQEQSDARRRDSPLRRVLPLVLSNAVRFMEPVHPGLLRALGPWRDHPLGSFDVDSIEVVRTDGFFSHDKTEVLSTVELRG